MEKTSTILLASLVLSALSSLAVAEMCTVNGKEVPCGQFWSDFGALFAGMGIMWVIIMGSIFVAIAIGLAFWVWMLIDCLKRDFKDKVPWLIVIIIGNTLGSILYYLLVKRKGK